MVCSNLKTQTGKFLRMRIFSCRSVITENIFKTEASLTRAPQSYLQTYHNPTWLPACHTCTTKYAQHMIVQLTNCSLEYNTYMSMYVCSLRGNSKVICLCLAITCVFRKRFPKRLRFARSLFVIVST